MNFYVFNFYLIYVNKQALRIKKKKKKTKVICNNLIEIAISIKTTELFHPSPQDHYQHNPFPPIKN